MTGMTPGLDWDPRRVRQSFSKAPCPPPHLPLFPLSGLRCLERARTLCTVLYESQEESHSEPTVVFNFISTLMPLLCRCISLGLHPCLGPSHLSTWEKPTRGLEKSLSQQNRELPALGQGNGSLKSTYSVPATNPGPFPNPPRLTVPAAL